MERLDYFLNDRMKTIVVLHQHQIEVNNVKFCPMNQDEIASEIGCSKVKTNQLLKELVDTGYVEVLKKGRYVLTDSAIKVIEKLELGE